jgi:hypothetical protein
MTSSGWRVERDHRRAGVVLLGLQVEVAKQVLVAAVDAVEDADHREDRAVADCGSPRRRRPWPDRGQARDGTGAGRRPGPCPARAGRPGSGRSRRGIHRTSPDADGSVRAPGPLRRSERTGRGRSAATAAGRRRTSGSASSPASTGRSRPASRAGVRRRPRRGRRRARSRRRARTGRSRSGRARRGRPRIRPRSPRSRASARTYVPAEQWTSTIATGRPGSAASQTGARANRS